MEAITRKLLAIREEAPLVLGDISWSQVAGVLKEKLLQLQHIFQDAAGFLVEKLDQIFPPETRADTLRHWLHFGLTVLLPVAVVLFLLYCCCCRSCCRSCCRRAGRMMKAPGRHGAVMPRAAFEANPRTYFINLRANKDFVF